jgi:hypothetical protein
MNLQEIVAAVINHVTVSTDMAKIEAARTFGAPVHFVSRNEARVQSELDTTGLWSQLADAATLFFCSGGQIYRAGRPAIR